MRGEPAPEIALPLALQVVTEIFACDRATLRHPCDPSADRWWLIDGSQNRKPHAMTETTSALFDRALQAAKPLACEVPAPNSDAAGVALAIPLASGHSWLLLLEGGAAPMSDASKRLLEAVGDQLGEWIELGLHLDGLKLVERQLREAQQVAELGNWSHDLVTGEILWSDEAFRILGYTPRVVTPEFVFSVVYPDDLPTLGEAMARSVSGEAPGEHDFRALTSTGEIKWIRNRWVSEYAATGEEIRRYGTHQDITQRKLADDEREQLQQQLLRSQKMDVVGQLAGGIAHDFNNILCCVQGASDLVTRRLQARLPMGDPALQDLSLIKRSVQRAAALTSQLLTLANREVVTAEVLDLNWVLSEFEDIFRRSLTENITVTVNTAPEAVVCVADRGQLEQLLLNLVVNARDAMASGGQLTVTAAKENNCAALTVRDTGCGMSSETLDRAFDPFFTTKPTRSGTGLGLATVRTIVDKWDGTLHVESTEGVGTVYRICFPISERPVPEPVTSSALDTTALANERVLLCEDDQGLRLVTERLLSEVGYQVTTVASAEEALAVFECNAPFQLLISDIVLPGKHGRELASSLRERQPHLKALLFSGYSADLLSDRGELGDETGFLAKPYTRERLLAAVRTVLEGG